MTCRFYRAVTPWEWEDIQIFKGFRASPRSLEDKQFAKSLECGHYYGREIVEYFDKVPYILLEILLDSVQFCGQQIQKLDDCDAVSIDRDTLSSFNTCILDIKKIN